MKERAERLKAIRRVIRSERITSQDSLLSHLAQAGYDVTQATLSRDLKLLKVGKVSDGAGGYAYSLLGDDERPESEDVFVQDFLRGYVSIDWNEPIVVIKTFGGHADAVSNALDALALDEILGTIAGENCIFACLRPGVTGPDFMRSLKAKIPDLDDL